MIVQNKYIREDVHITDLIYTNLKSIIRDDKKNISYLLYYSTLEATLLMVSPLTAAFIINSVLAHATVSITVLSFIIIVVFMMIALIQVLKEYMIEKFEQGIFVKNAINTSILAIENREYQHNEIDKYMNYFFDVVAIQKLLPALFMNASGLIIKIVVSLLLLLIFDINFFILAVIFILLFLTIVLRLGKHGPRLAIKRSDAKHEAIYFIQNISDETSSPAHTLNKLDTLLINFLETRRDMFSIIARQLAVSFFIEGLILSSFFILGGYLVFEGTIPIGDFVAIEIIILSVLNGLRSFMKQIDYIYDMVEGFYKIDKLSRALKKAEHV